jgi:hypothetical protein
MCFQMVPNSAITCRSGTTSKIVNRIAYGKQNSLVEILFKRPVAHHQSCGAYWSALAAAILDWAVCPHLRGFRSQSRSVLGRVKSARTSTGLTSNFYIWSLPVVSIAVSRRHLCSSRKPSGGRKPVEPHCWDLKCSLNRVIVSGMA